MDPCGNMSGEAILFPSSVDDENYYTNLIFKYECNKDLQAKLFLYRSMVKLNNSDEMGAISDLTISIEVKPSDYGYYHRGILKIKLNDLKGAVLDFDKSWTYCFIKSSPFRLDVTDISQTDIYLIRGKCHYALKNYISSLRDFKDLIKINDRNEEGNLYKGMNEYQIGNFTVACSDWRRAGDLGSEKAYELLKEFCQ
ncbi:MAG: hypothetical protein Q7J63_15235 [Rhodonellum sp.]|nr:hypothetical protein [Rhodonellum sp.]